MPSRAASVGTLIGAVATLLGAGTATAQQARTIVNFPLRLADLGLISDTLSGVQVLMQPSFMTKEGRKGQPVWLRFNPDTVLDWINSAAAALTRPVQNGPAVGIQWSRTLTPLGKQGGGIALGRERKKGNLEKTRWLAIGDSATGWRTALTGDQADSLLRLLMTMGIQSRLDTSSTIPRRFEDVDVPVAVVYQPRPKWTGTYGRVATRYVVDANGNIEAASFEALLASDPALVSEARSMIMGSRFKPAQLGGTPIRQQVQQMITWTP